MNQPTVNKPKKSTTLRNLGAGIVLAAAILAAGALWVLLGWRGALDITLTDLAGDPAALRGFTMRGQSCLDSAHTYWELRDGYLETSFALDPDNVDTTWRYAYNMAGATTSIFYAVTPESRDAVNAAASLWQPSSGTSQWWESTATTFRPMVTIHLSGGVLRVALPDVTAKEPLAVSANANREHVQRTDCRRPTPPARRGLTPCPPTASCRGRTSSAPPPSSAAWSPSTARRMPTWWPAAWRWMTA